MFRNEILALLTGIPSASELLETPPDPQLGDYALPCFALAKTMKKAPAQIAQEIAQRITSPFLDHVEAKGPYVNFFIKPEARAKEVLRRVAEQRIWEFGNKRETILVESPGPNTNKPLHLGHVRNMVLGSAVINLLRADGNNVVQVNINNDRGVHICKSMLAYQEWGEGKEPDKKSDHFVGDYYVLFEKKAQEDPSLNERAQAMLKRWEEGDPGIRKLWKKMNTWAHKGFEKTYTRYNVHIDKEYYESDVYLQGKAIVEQHSDVFEKDEKGNIFAPLEKHGLPDKVVLRADGTSVYITQDLALTIERIEEYRPDLHIWVVANEQNLHFQQLFKILELIGYKNACKLHHLSYGMVHLPQGRMKSREGTVVDADDILDDLERLAGEGVRARRTDWTEEIVDEVSKKIALASIRFLMLKYDPLKDFTFDMESSLSFEGDTGPYLQYTHVRMCSILKKVQDTQTTPDYTALTGEHEQALLRIMEATPSAFRSAADQYRPSILATHLLGMSRAFNSFYHAIPVLQAEDAERCARIALIRATKKILAEGLGLLGIDAPEEM